MIYELRVYEAAPGRLPDLNARFANHTLGFFARHGIKVVGFWTEEVQDDHSRLIDETYQLTCERLLQLQRGELQ